MVHHKLNIYQSSMLDYQINSVPINTTRRFSCPSCGHAHTLSITNTQGKILYHCFSDSCDLSGAYNYVPDATELKEYRVRMKEEAKLIFKLPSRIKKGWITTQQVEYGGTTNQLIASNAGRFDWGYDTQEVRHVWFLRELDNREILGAIGRALERSWPKVQIYENSKTMPFICGTNYDSCVIVEDCASACSVNCTNEFTGVALLGTYLKEEYLPYLSKFKRIRVALDPDARSTGLNIKNSLTYICKDVKLWNIPCDFKDMSEIHVRRYFSERLSDGTY